MKPVNQQIPVNESGRYCAAGIGRHQLLTCVSAWKLSFVPSLCSSFCY